MDIAIVADDTKKELMAQFCIAYCPILARHHLYATQVTGKYIVDATGLDIEFLMPGSGGGCEQILSRIAYDEIDLLFYFRGTDPSERVDNVDQDLLRLCDVRNIPFATNIATAETLVMALDNGTLDWREFINPRSDYNRRRREQKAHA